ncbi:MAG: DNA polymerase III subunit alpha [Verrucomicrobiaceae bacterium]|nr:DNA polymerase III subunit alpha [Verrucomicrobiaceae bacterium]
MAEPYTELHARSALSFLRGASRPEDLVRQTAALGMTALGLCDRDGVYGSARAQYATRELISEFHAIVGSELTMEDESVVPLLAETRLGYQNLCRLITRAKLRALKNDSRVLWSELEEGAEGLVCLTGDEEGPIRRALAAREFESAATSLARLVRIFGRERVYVEVQRHHVRGEEWMIRRLRELAEQFRLPLLATNGACYALPSGRVVFDAFTCQRHHTHLDEAGILLASNSQRYLKGASEMKGLFADLPEAITNTVRLRERLTFSLRDLGYQFPTYPAPEGETVASFLRIQTDIGAKKRYGRITSKIRKQLDHELAIIEKLGFCGYFLIVWDIVNTCREKNVMVQGRGSAANSAVCYCLEITAADAIKHELFFERFLSEGRHSWPDIDLDLPSGDRRESIIQSVYERFRPNGAAMTANVITYRGRSAMREMGKALNLPEDTLKRFSDLYGGHGIADTGELRKRIGLAGLSAQHPRLPALLSLYQKVYGLPRHLGQHSGGMIISDKGLDSVVPLEPASMPNRVVAQWDKDDCEDLGIIKVDLLGLGMMSALQDCFELCRTRGNGREIDGMAAIPPDDPATYDMIQKADTIGLFQIESRAQMATLPRLRPRRFYDLVVEVAIIRLGPIVGNMVHPYIERRNGREEPDYIDPRFEPVLKRTLGVPLFQEQVLQMAVTIANFSGSEAEELRRAISFNRSEERMQKVLLKLRAGMDKNGVSKETQGRIEEAIHSFALYGFPESHAISFALLAYASAWLKRHRAAEFYVSLLNNYPMGFYSRATLVRDAKAHGLRVKPVSVIDSNLECRVEADDIIRLGLSQTKALSRSTAERLVMLRQERPWNDLPDFLARVRPNKKERRVLAKIGALNGLAEHRRDALWKAEQRVVQGDFFAKVANDTTTELPPMSSMERLDADYAGLGLTTGPHPMAYVREHCQAANIWKASDLEQGRDGQSIVVAGLVICRQRPSTANGHLFLSLEDETGVSNAFVPAPIFERYRLVIVQEPFLKIHGRLQHADNVTSVYTHHVSRMPFKTSLGTESHDFH